MLGLAVAALIIFVLTTGLTIAGVGAAFGIIPFLYWLGIPLKEVMATALLLNSISMSFASITFIRKKLVTFQIAVPVMVVASILSPLGAYSTQFVSKDFLLWSFSAFLFFAASMMLFFKPRRKEEYRSSRKGLLIGSMVGAVAGYLGGLLGVGGGNFIVPALIWVGYDPRIAAATSCFIVIFSSLAGFFGHAALGNVNLPLLTSAASASIAGGLVGAWLLSFKLKGSQVKRVIGIVLYLIAAKMIWGLV